MARLLDVSSHADPKLACPLVMGVCRHLWDCACAIEQLVCESSRVRRCERSFSAGSSVTVCDPSSRSVTAESGLES